MLIDEKHLNEALSHAADLAAQKSKMMNGIKSIIANLEAGAFKVIICDDGKERDVTAENIENLKALLN